MPTQQELLLQIRHNARVTVQYRPTGETVTALARQGAGGWEWLDYALPDDDLKILSVKSPALPRRIGTHLRIDHRLAGETVAVVAVVIPMRPNDSAGGLALSYLHRDGTPLGWDYLSALTDETDYIRNWYVLSAQEVEDYFSGEASE